MPVHNSCPKDVVTDKANTLVVAHCSGFDPFSSKFILCTQRLRRIHNNQSSMLIASPLDFL